MGLKEDFVKALKENERMNKKKDNSVKACKPMTIEEIRGIYSDPIKPTINFVSTKEMESIEKGFQEAKELNYDMKLVKECPISTEWIKEDESDNEEEVPVTVVEVIKKCECGGEFKYTPGMTQTLEYPPHYTHTCNKCGKKVRFIKIYPYQKYKRVEESVND